MNDMVKVTEPKSDQWNFDDFQAGPITFKIEGVKVKGGQEQPVEISLAGTPKFYRPCKSMSRCLVAAWGADSAKYAGRSLTLYGDPSIKWGGMAVGGIRISHMSDIDSALTMALTVTRANRKPFTVRPLKTAAPKGGDAHEPIRNSTENSQIGQDSVTGGAYPNNAQDCITADETVVLEKRLDDNAIALTKVKKAFGVERLSMLTPEQLASAHAMIDTTIKNRRSAT